MSDKNIHIKALLDRCLKGDQKAYFEIYKLYYHAMYNAAIRIMNDAMEAEDMMQEAFLTAFQKLDTFKQKSRFGKKVVPFGAWLKRIVINKCISQLKKNDKFIDTNLEIIGEAVEEEQGHDFEKHQVAEVMKGLNTLNTNYKTALTLNLIEGYDYEEIGEIMNISNQNCRTIISRAKNKLRNNILQSNAQQQI